MKKHTIIPFESMSRISSVARTLFKTPSIPKVDSRKVIKCRDGSPQRYRSPKRGGLGFSETREEEAIPAKKNGRSIVQAPPTHSATLPISRMNRRSHRSFRNGAVSTHDRPPFPHIDFHRHCLPGSHGLGTSTTEWTIVPMRGRAPDCRNTLHGAHQ
jgi:hypothetical protein